MPTARELLEQADALMRRNRGRDSVQPPPALIVAPDIPVLTDVVEAPAPTQLEAKAPAPATADVPVLTEAVEDIEVAPLVEDAEQGEPSIWVDSPDEDKSVMGAAPDSVVVVPPHDLRARGAALVTAEKATPDPELERALEQELEAEPDMAAMLPAAASVPVPSEPVAFEPAVPALAQPAIDAPPAVEIVEAAPPPDESETEPEFEPEPEPELEPDARPEFEEEPARRFVTPLAVPVIPAPMAVPLPVEAARAGMPADDDRWRQLAEDVRMQVLQRIDMFTDTGLREQLGERLKPIVDRASADLVATINQHVGELLRTYVAEAIEREIERWRHDGER